MSNKHFTDYITQLQSKPIDEVTEYSFRTALESLFLKTISELEKETIRTSSIKIIHEPKRIENFGAPDFLVYTNYSIIGYIENKKITENLDNVLKSEQIKKYCELSDNILLTNYLEFIWIKVDKNNQQRVITRETLCYLTDLDNKRFKPDNIKIEKVENLINNFFSIVPERIVNPKKLAEVLASRCRLLKDSFEAVFNKQLEEKQTSLLQELFSTLKRNIFNELTIPSFSDAFAQMLVFSLFLARLNADTKIITRDNIKRLIPSTFQLIRELVNFFDELEKSEYKEAKWIIDEIFSIINNIDLPELSKELSFSNRIKDTENYETDPYIYFYETFLASYDKDLRKSKGVYYTPKPVVNHIIRSIDHILKSEFNVSEGLADSKSVTVLDFATGTGSFIAEIFEFILNNIHPASKAKTELIIKEHLLKNIYGFEYLFAPYIIAHLKLSQMLKENGHNFIEGERLNIYLTNTLEPVEIQERIAFLPYLTIESQSAQEIKKKPILVITGNPPYSISSTNKGSSILNLLNDYKEGLNEKKINIDDDYIKFIRFAHNKIMNAGEGIIAIITNNSFLDGVTHRKMREKLFNDFDIINILNLHGNSIKNEGDENVFDIRVGVAITILVKLKKSLKNKKVFYTSTKELGINKREEKYKFLLHENIERTQIYPEQPYYWFVNSKFSKHTEYNNYLKITDIFDVYSVGIGTKVDSIAIDFDEERLKHRIKDILTNKYRINEIINKYGINKRTTWEYERALKSVFNENKIVDYDYRPFDIRKIFFDNNFLSRSRSKVMDNFINYENIGLEVNRLQDFICFVSDKISDEHFCGGKSYKLPLYIYNSNTENGNGFFNTQKNQKVNFKKEFKEFIKNDLSFLKNRKNFKIEEQILGYIYAIMHSQSYRVNYSEFLKIDFPRIPFNTNEEIFSRLSKLGWELIQHHLLKVNYYGTKFSDYGYYIGNSDNIVIKPEYHRRKLYINKIDYFDNVPNEVWNFKIGSYQILDKLLKERKERDISQEFPYIERVIRALTFTIFQMKRIELITKDWI